MGSICSCFGVEDFEEYRNTYGSVYRHCICLRFLAQQLMHMLHGPSTGHDKPETQFDEESEPLRRAKNNGRTESTSVAAKWSGFTYEVSSKCCSESSMNHTSIEKTGQVAYIFPSSEEEDVCPTCLEEYTSENPRIILQCSHHFHLGCIYEWMERSELCPVCGKVMVFNESR